MFLVALCVALGVKNVGDSLFGREANVKPIVVRVALQSVTVDVDVAASGRMLVKFKRFHSPHMNKLIDPVVNDLA